MRISEDEFARICSGLQEDRESILKHNPIGTDDEIMLWMLLSCLISYLSLIEIETPCFTGRPDDKTYRNAIAFILSERRTEPFEIEPYLEQLLEK